MLELAIAPPRVLHEDHRVVGVDDEDAVADGLARGGAGAVGRDDDAPRAHLLERVLRLRELGACVPYI